MRYDLATGVEFTHTLRKVVERDQVAIDVTDLIFVRLSYIKHEDILARILALLKLFNGNRRYLGVVHRLFFSANSAEFVVIDQLMDRTMLAARRAIRILPQLQFAETHRQCVNEEKASNQWIACPENKLDRLGCLHHADQSRKNSEHSSLCTRRNESGGRWFRIEAPVARTLFHSENADIAL